MWCSRLKYSEKCFEVFAKILLVMSDFYYWLAYKLETWAIRILDR